MSDVEEYLGCNIDCGCCAVKKCDMDALHLVVDEINGGEDGNKKMAKSIVVLPTFVNVKNYKPCGYTATMGSSAPIPQGCLDSVFFEQIVGVVLDQNYAENRVANRALVNREDVVARALEATDETRLATLVCRAPGNSRDTRLWTPTLGRKGFVGIFESRSPKDGEPPIRVLLARVGATQASTELHTGLLEEKYNDLSVGEFVGCCDYDAARCLSRRNALRLLVVAADAYGVKVPHEKDPLRAERDTEELTPDIESLERGLGKKSEIAIVTYHNEGSMLLPCDNKQTVEYYDGCTCTKSALGGLVYIHDPLKTICVFDYDKAGISDASVMPPAWPMARMSNTSQKPDEVLSVVFPKWKQGAIMFKPITVLATPDLTSCTC